MSRLSLASLLVIFLIVSGCGGNRKLINFRKDIEIDYFDFDYLTAKAKIKYKEGKKSVSASANIRVKKDSILWMSISPGLGVEVARVMINQDSIYLMDRLKKKLYRHSFAGLSKKFDFDLSYNMVESVALGNLIYPYQRERMKRDENYRNYQQRVENFLFNNYIGNETRKLEQLQVEDITTKNTISVNYGEFKEVNDKIFPFEIAARINYVEGSKQPIDINIGFSRAEIAPQPLRFPFNAPSKYKRVLF